MRSPARANLFRWLAASGALTALASLGLTWGYLRSRPEATPTDPGPAADSDPFPIPPLSASPFLNTRPEARFVGSESCRRCHEKATDSYLRTGMGRSMAEVTPDRAPPDAEFDHAPSRRRYQVFRKGGPICHRDRLLTSGAADVVLEELPLRWVIG